MKKFFEKITQPKFLWLGLVIVLQTVVYVIAGAQKAYFHMDEMYSYGLANYERVQIYENEDFYNQWHNADYYKDYIVVNDDERGNFAPVYNNQRDDVHPPLYYLLLRIGMEMTPGQFSKWTGIIINIVAFAVNTVFIFLIAEKLLQGERNASGKALAFTLVAALSMSAISTVMYIRMYAMLTMFVTITMWLHLKMAESKETNWKLLTALGVTALLGVLTQYYYVFFLLPLFIMTVVRYVKAERKQELWRYMGALVVAAVISLIIWPYSIKHMFFGYRGLGVMGNLLNFANLGMQVGIFFGMLTLYNFSGMLPFILITMFAIMVYALKRGKILKVPSQNARDYSLILWPTVIFFLIASVASPFQDLRYIEAVGGLMTIAVLYGLYCLVKMVTNEKNLMRIMAGVMTVLLIMPLIMGLEPNVSYTRMAKLNGFVAEHKSIPTIFLYNPANERILDDLTSFAELDESYVMHHQDYTEENFDKVLAGKDLSRGLIVFANYGDENERYLEVLREATGLENQEYIIRTNSADVYYLTEK